MILERHWVWVVAREWKETGSFTGRKEIYLNSVGKANKSSQYQIKRRKVSLEKEQPLFICFQFFLNRNCILNMQIPLEIKNMNHVAIIPWTLELIFIVPVVSFVPSQWRNQMRKYQYIFMLWICFPLVYVCARLCLYKKKKKYMEVTELYLHPKKMSAKVHNEWVVIFITEL